MKEKYLYSEITKEIIGGAYEVFNNLGFGFLEKVYENALVLELKKRKLNVNQQFPINVYYKNEIVGEYIADLIIEKKVIAEIKAISKLEEIQEVQLVNYLKATKIEIGLLVNFGKRLEIKRRIFNK
ncbi:GxxExxY protein [Candidatus Desantisbacteria bacterium CG_4_10_14_0_8_um_filter_48_22]|uniref:GxxExxY protein n=1 Tax=Candidatus Desantisbacteria bacterium CG_4_10_14_0_8_um_filter_48_22 TaxID=1974543 RepID=A0A2M7S8S4_9BACT|nr:MAG: GxxExxY protein [Candidatus Desantisbacteria bacterium CG1_02_49_89]PIV55840.1 MAG: GxxExxY protein [Candidatus Desantisbacteria bacterium CG02_land_8_20_14_3_00_49_13]PIZ15917.1 MAG: GxxExxY protein [Candidatus Desantisbacteria bacterium CG_4_10_14_0_8_um_filter_48_22]